MWLLLKHGMAPFTALYCVERIQLAVVSYSCGWHCFLGGLTSVDGPFVADLQRGMFHQCGLAEAGVMLLKADGCAVVVVTFHVLYLCQRCSVVPDCYQWEARPSAHSP